jgi:hypothetical protein
MAGGDQLLQQCAQTCRQCQVSCERMVA